MTVSILKQHEFLPEHKAYIAKYHRSLELLSKHDNGLIMGLKDVESRYMVTNNAHAKAVGCSSPHLMLGLSDADMPCQDTSSYAEQYRDEDTEILHSKDMKIKSSYLKVHYYADGFKGRLIRKSVLYHEETNSILGILFNGSEINLSRLLSIMPSYSNLMRKTKNTGTYKIPNQGIVLNGVALNYYEYEVCFFICHGWTYVRIAEFMNNRSNGAKPKSADTIIKTKDRICHKLKLSAHKNQLRDLCIENGIHNQIPQLVLDSLLGCWQV